MESGSPRNYRRFPPWLTKRIPAAGETAKVGRILADLTGLWQLRLWFGLLNGIALTLFIGTMMVMVVRGLKVGGRSSA